jgi:hypothetical protein
MGNSIITGKNYKNFPTHSKRFSLKHLDTSHVFFAYFRKIVWENGNNVNLVAERYFDNFQKNVMVFVSDYKKVSKLENLPYSYEQKIPYFIEFCKRAYLQTTDELNKGIEINSFVTSKV